MPNIAILTQQQHVLDNRSIQLLMKALEEKGATVTLLPFLSCSMTGNGFIDAPCMERKQADGYDVFVETQERQSIDVRTYDSVIVRTWGPARTKGVEYGGYFRTYGALGEYDLDAVKISHSKILLHSFFKELGLPIPVTQSLARTALEATTLSLVFEQAVARFGPSFIVKGEAGTRADATCFIEKAQGGKDIFLQFVEKYLQNNKGKGIVLQQYIQTAADIRRSYYLRFNIVNGQVQSAVRFVGAFNDQGRLVDEPEKDRPFEVTKEIESLLKPLCAHPLFKRGVWGLDALQDINASSSSPTYTILEINPGPHISLIVGIGEKTVDAPGAKACLAFANAYAESALALLQHKESVALPGALKIAVLKETRAGEKRVSVTPDTAKQLVALGYEVWAEKDAGLASGFTNEAYTQAGAQIAETTESLLANASLISCLKRPGAQEEQKLLSLLKGRIPSPLLVGFFDPLKPEGHVMQYKEAGLTTLSLELLPQTKATAAMDASAAMGRLAGRIAFKKAFADYTRNAPDAMPKVLILGGGNAGTSAAAAAHKKGLTPIVCSTGTAHKDFIENEAKGIFITLPSDTTTQPILLAAKQRHIIEEVIKEHTPNIMILSARRRGEKAPLLLSSELIYQLDYKAHIEDLTATIGGNTPLTQTGQSQDFHNVTLSNLPNYPSQKPAKASTHYSACFYNIAKYIGEQSSKQTPLSEWVAQDDVLSKALLTHKGKIIPLEAQKIQSLSLGK